MVDDKGFVPPFVEKVHSAICKACRGAASEADGSV
jgi:hypothetical protein